MSTVVLMCGLPGAGKTTYAMELVRRGFARLSVDEVVWQRLGQRDAGPVLGAEAFDRLKEEVRREQRQELVELMLAGRDVVVDYSFWCRAARDDYKTLIDCPRRSSQNDLGHPRSRLRRHPSDHTTRRNQCHTRNCSPPRRSSPTRRSC
ncbi:AAA family ATPase [Streptomyces cacaoi]|uniref:AAA family ATPase n=1 Tax=Streptomyces cacaoi TaxID=1898 RepID=UPI003747E549